MPTFSRSLEQSLHRALALANERHHEYATLEHLLLALIEDQDAAAVMRACNVDLQKLRRSLVAYLESELDNLITDGADDSKPTAGFQRVLQRAVIHVQSSGREEVTGANVLVAIFAERESHAAYFLQEQEMTRYDAVNYISHGIAKRPGVSEARPVRGAEEEADSKSGDEPKKKGDSVYRRDPHRDRRRRDLRRFNGCIQSAQTSISVGHGALHRLDHLQGIPAVFREGSGAGPSLPEDRRQRADHPGRHRDPQRAQTLFRGLSQAQIHERRHQGCGRAFVTLHP